VSVQFVVARCRLCAGLTKGTVDAAGHAELKHVSGTTLPHRARPKYGRAWVVSRAVFDALPLHWAES
jgi:hypothetical protein